MSRTSPNYARCIRLVTLICVSITARAHARFPWLPLARSRLYLLVCAIVSCVRVYLYLYYRVYFLRRLLFISFGRFALAIPKLSWWGTHAIIENESVSCIIRIICLDVSVCSFIHSLSICNSVKTDSLRYCSSIYAVNTNNYINAWCYKTVFLIVKIKKYKNISC